MENHPIYRGVPTGVRFVQCMLVFMSELLLVDGAAPLHVFLLCFGDLIYAFFAIGDLIYVFIYPWCGDGGRSSK